MSEKKDYVKVILIHAVSAGKNNAYYVDENLIEKFTAGFEPLSEDEIDVRVKNGY